MFDIIETKIDTCYEINCKTIKDNRGKFIKTFHHDKFKELDLIREFKEEYYSVSAKGVLRGMHFQKKPYHHDKMVYCVQGSVIDVVLDLRRDSNSFKKYEIFKLNSEQANMLFIPAGCAHGFYSLEDNSIMMYKVTSVYNPAADSGILWNSFGYEWPVDQPIVSERDQALTAFIDYKDYF